MENLPLEASLLSLAAVFSWCFCQLPACKVSLGFLWVRKRLSEGAGVWAELRCPSQHGTGTDGALQECSLSALARH